MYHLINKTLHVPTFMHTFVGKKSLSFFSIILPIGEDVLL